jgi:glycerate 2-kinase
VEAVDPARLVRAATSRGILQTGAQPCLVVAAGKAAAAMVSALGEAVRIRAGVIATAGGAVTAPSHIRCFNAGHPFPTQESVAAAEEALAMVGAAAPDEMVVVLLSGGASAMLCAPADGVSLDDKVAATRTLMDAGVPIDGLNCVRRHMSRIKGGRLGAAASCSVTLALSDVHAPVEDDPTVIGSGPTAADPTTFADALHLVRARGVDMPASVLAHLERGVRGEVEDSVKPGDPRLARAKYEVLGNRHTALEGAMGAAQDRGYTVLTLAPATTGEARKAAQAFLSEARWLASDASRPLCVLAAGETTVTVTGNGSGGRNQEFALGTVPLIGGVGRAAVLASAGTDGVDGPTDAAGALVDSSTLERASRAGVDWQSALARNDAYAFFEPLGDLIKWGPTGTNVGDVQVLLIA